MRMKILKLFCLASFFMICFFGTAGASFVENIQTDYLKNGLKVITVEDHKDPIITFQIWYKVGGINEIIGKTGLSHLTEHMMFKGSEKFGKGEISRTVARNGGSENAFTSQDYTAYFQNFSKDKLEISLEIESDRMVNLQINPREFLLERDVVMEERRQRIEDDPTSSVIEEMYAAAFKLHPYRNPTIGWMNDLKHLTSKDLENWYNIYYRPNNATIILVGDFERKEALSRIASYFETIDRGSAPPPVNIVEPEQKGERKVWLKREAQLPFVFAGYKAPRIGHEDEFPLTVLANILSAGESSRLYRSLVYKKQLAVYAGGSYDNISRGPSLFYFYAGVRPGVKAEDVEKAIYEELEKIKKNGATGRELQKAKNQLEASFIMSQDSIFYQAMMLGRLESAGADHTYLEKYIRGIRKVTAEDVIRVAKKYLIWDKRTVAILVPEKKEGKDEE